ncbi:hypothetical protein KPC83_07075 [Collinsella sp. zg1085]|uniref:hypothetical protein n=1 Tax=Collinsella sp. zg1085 TaxID=2844380 RepID=UPI001C0BEAB7|nr:hypothetical protein [Collinsella sp. zg1085]QWT17585.1 hypothetical protein KPC83_07075 [Collinsella sp. zg1085]
MGAAAMKGSCWILATLAFASLIPLPAHALEIISAETLPVEDRIDGCIEGMPESIGSFSVKECINTSKGQFALYPTLDHPEKVFEALKENRCVKTLKELYDFETISSHNWRNYQNNMYGLLNGPHKQSWLNTESEESFRQLRSALSVYESNLRNAETKEHVLRLTEYAISDAAINKDLQMYLPQPSIEKLVATYGLGAEGAVSKPVTFMVLPFFILLSPWFCIRLYRRAKRARNYQHFS